MKTKLYNFKQITTIPRAKDFIDVVLSKTQRKTPTVVHPQFKISRIRNFYSRKVKYMQQTIHDRLGDILLQFPKMDELHPFYSSLFNVLYDRDHYKIALSQVRNVQNTVDSIAKDYVRLLKYADSAFKCKMLKRAGFGRMVTALRKLDTALQYLDEVRQHLGRLPSIDPSTRSLLLAGYPNVGKSSFMNRISHADVEVQPFAFTTKSLFVGHFDHNYSRWQAIDTPGVLDRPFDQRNVIENTALTALVHVQAAVLFVVDVTDTCGYTISDQAKLFNSLKSLFSTKPVLCVLNKTDLRPVSDLSADETASLETMREGISTLEFVHCSCATAEGVDFARNRACEMLMNYRVTKKVASQKVTPELQNRLLTVNTPPPADRPPQIPSSVRGMTAKPGTTARDRMEEGGGAGVFVDDERKAYILKKEEWRYDVVPTLLDGRNIADFVSADVEERLASLVAEENQLSLTTQLSSEVDTEWVEMEHLLERVRNRIKMHREQKRIDQPQNHVVIPRTIPSGHRRITRPEAEKRLAALGHDPDKLKLPIKEKRKHTLERHFRTLGLKQREALEDGMEDVATARQRLQNLRQSLQLGRARHTAQKLVPKDGRVKAIQTLKGRSVDLSLHHEKDRILAEKLRKVGMRKINKAGKKGEADRFIGTIKPKHLYSGKRGIGKTQWR